MATWDSLNRAVGGNVTAPTKYTKKLSGWNALNTQAKQSMVYRTQKQEEYKPGFGMRNFQGSMQTLAELQKDPLSIKEHKQKFTLNPVKAFKQNIKQGKEFVSDYAGGIKESVVSAGQSLRKSYELGKKDRGKPSFEKVGQGLETTSRLAGAVLSPITSFFTASKNQPVLGSLARIAELPFSVAGESASAVVGKAVDKIPLMSKESKEKITPGLQEFVSLVAQLAVGKAGEVGGKKVGEVAKSKYVELTKKYGAEDAKTIISKAHEVAKVEPAFDYNKLIDDVARQTKQPLIGGEAPKLLGTATKATRGEGFTFADKVDKQKIAVGKAINDYRVQRAKYIQEPTAAQLVKVQKAKVVMDEAKGAMAKAEAAIPLEKPLVPEMRQPQAIPRTSPQVLSEIKPIKEVVSEIKPTKGEISGVAKNIEAKAIEQGLIDKGFTELAEYNSSTIKKQGELGSKYNIEQLKEMAQSGKLPEGMKPATPLSILEDYAKNTKDLALQVELAKSPLVSRISESASELSLSRMREKGSTVENIRQVYEARKEAVAEVAKSEVKKIKESIKKTKPTKDAWLNFVESIKC